MHYTVGGAAALFGARYAAISSATAGGTGDATEVDGAYIDRRGFSALKVVIAYKATLAEGKTLSIAANLQDATSSGGSGVADFGDALAATVVATGGSGGSTVTGVVELDFDLTGAEAYVRVQYTPDLNATGTDTATLAVTYVLCGAESQPATAGAN